MIARGLVGLRAVSQIPEAQSKISRYIRDSRGILPDLGRPQPVDICYLGLDRSCGGGGRVSVQLLGWVTVTIVFSILTDIPHTLVPYRVYPIQSPVILQVIPVQ